MVISLCGTSVGNTGAILCDVAPGIPKAVYIWNGSKPVSTVTGAAFQTFLETTSKLSKADADKLFVFPVIQDVADATEADATGSLNQGFSQVLREGKPAYTFKVFAGQSLVPQLRKFNNQNIRVLILDSNKRVWGVQSGTSFIGSQAKIKTSGLKYATGQNVEEGVVTISLSFLDASEVNDDAAYGEVVSTAGVVGLIDATLIYVSNVANAYKIGVAIQTAEVGEEINVLDTYSTQLAAAGLWVAKTGATFGTTLVITSVAYDATLGLMTVTFDSTAYTALVSGAKIKLSLTTPALLDIADVDNIESVAVILTK